MTLAYPPPFLQDIVTDSDSMSLSLAILIHITRQIFHADSPSPFGDLDILRTLSQFDVGIALPSLKRDFCALWNELVLEAMNEQNNSKLTAILREIRGVYIKLHPGTDGGSSSLYPLCTIGSHRPDSSGDGPHLTRFEDPPLSSSLSGITTVPD
jgi:hypothetical protein